MNKPKRQITRNVPLQTPSSAPSKIELLYIPITQVPLQITVKMSFLMTLSAEEHAVIMTMRQKTGKHLFFDDNGAEMPVKPKRTLTDEHKAKIKASREANKAKKATKAATTVEVDTTSELKDLQTKSGQELRNIYHPLIGKKIGMKHSPTAPIKAVLIREIRRLRAAGHTPENPSKKAKAE